MNDKIQQDDEVPLLQGLKVGIIYNLKQDDGKNGSQRNHEPGKKDDLSKNAENDSIPDEEAEYNGIENGTIPDEEAEYDSIETVFSLKAAIEKIGAKAELLPAGKELFRELETTPIDIAFNIAEGSHGRSREAEVPAILNLYGIPYTGSDGTTLCVALDKAMTKRILSTYHILSPGDVVLSSQNMEIPEELHYPVIVKPNAEGSSKGVGEKSIVESKEELLKLAETNIRLYHQEMLAEEYIEGREFTVGVLGNGEEIRIFNPMEIVYKEPTQGDYHVYSFSVKKEYQKYVSYVSLGEEINCDGTRSNKTEDHQNITTQGSKTEGHQNTMAQGSSLALRDNMMRIAKQIYEALGCRDFARMDFRVSDTGDIYFIEINPLPGLAPGYSDYPMLAEFCGIGYEELVQKILLTAVKRCKKGGELK